MISVRSLRDLIQEEHYPDEFRVLVCCLLLNRCRGVVARGVARELFHAYPSAAAMAAADQGTVATIVKPLGLQNRRAALLRRFAAAYEAGGWVDAAELPGVGEYARDCWRIFFLEDLGDEPPRDHALVDYWNVARDGLWPVGGWPPDEAVERRREAVRERMAEEERRRGSRNRRRTPQRRLEAPDNADTSMDQSAARKAKKP